MVFLMGELGHWFGMSCVFPEKTRYSPDVVSTLGQRLRRWPNIEPTSCECLVFFLGWLWYQSRQSVCRVSHQTRDAESMLIQSWPIVSDSGPTLNQHWFSISCLRGAASRDVCWGRGVTGGTGRRRIPGLLQEARLWLGYAIDCFSCWPGLQPIESGVIVCSLVSLPANISII